MESREKAIKMLQDKNITKFWCMTVDDDDYMSSHSNCTVADAEVMLRMMVDQTPSMKNVILDMAIQYLKECKDSL